MDYKHLCMRYRPAISSIVILCMWLCSIAQSENEDSMKVTTPRNCVYNCILTEPVAGDELDKTTYACTEGLRDKSFYGKKFIVTKVTPIPKSWILKVNNETISKIEILQLVYSTTTYGEISSPTGITVMSLQDRCNPSGRASNVKKLSKSAKTGIIEACSGKLKKINQGQGEIKSPGYPRPYPKRKPPITCRWKIATNPGSLLEISFDSISLRSKTRDYPQSKSAEYERYRITHGKSVFSRFQDCRDEYVTITDPYARKGDAGWVHYGKFCGDWTAPRFVTVGNAVVITFVGSSSGRKQGFSLKYKTVDPPSGLIAETDQSNDVNWNDARNQCEEMGKDLCTMKEICRIGRPFYGVERGNVWTPVLDEYDDWIQIGEAKGQTCQRHNLLYGPPQWGRSGFSRPSFKTLYCCDPLTVIPAGRFLTQENLPAAYEVLVRVYTTSQNGRTFYRYLREGFDTIDEGGIWSSKKVHTRDLSTIILYSAYHKKATEPVYFCYKPLLLAVGQMRTVYTMSNKPCDRASWKLSFYLYASKEDDSNGGVQTIHVGISSSPPYHSRLRFGNFPRLFQNPSSFILHAKTNDPQPDSGVNSTNPLREVGVTCSKEVQTLIAPTVLMSPGYPKKYKPLSDCKWRVKLSDSDMDLGMKLQLTVEELDLEDESDYLYVYEVNPDTDITNLSTQNVLKEYTGTVRSTSLTTKNSFILHFTSDYSIEQKGFRLIAKTLYDQCGGYIRNHGATVQSPNYPKHYEPDLKCSWMIEAPVGFGIEIQFQKFEISNSTRCKKDFVSIGTSKQNSERLCGVHQNPPLREFSDKLVYLNFTSRKKQSNNKGFAFTVRFWPVGYFGGNRTRQKCGQQKIPPWSAGGERSTERIIGGLEAIAGSWPWMIHIPKVQCGGVLLNERWAMTAAHCVVGSKSDDGSWSLKNGYLNYTIIAGRHDKTDSSSNEQVLGIQNIIVHPKFDRVRLGNAGKDNPQGIPVNDIALILLKPKASFTVDSVAPICLPTQDVAVGESCVIAGWGAREVLAALSLDYKDTLHYAHVYVISNRVCNTYLDLQGSVTSEMICAGYEGGGADSCSGDSGGPLMCKGPDGGYQVRGIVSWGRGCGKRHRPGLYTRVYSFYPWISNTILK